MTTGELAQCLRSLYQRRPFAHFEIGFSSGERITVTHPETIQQKDDVFVHYGPNRDYRIFTTAGVSEISLQVPPK